MQMYVTCGVGDASARDIDKAMKLGAGMCCVCNVCNCAHTCVHTCVHMHGCVLCGLCVHHGHMQIYYAMRNFLTHYSLFCCYLILFIPQATPWDHWSY